MLTLQLRQIDVPQGQRVLLHDISWQEFEEVIEELGDRRTSHSASFPDFPVIEGISQFVEMSRKIGMSRALRAFCQWVSERK
jgi:hypothetical protein